MGWVRNSEIPLLLGFAMFYGVVGFTASPFGSSSCGLSVLQVPHVGVPQVQRPTRRKLKLTVSSASEGGVGDGMDEYKKKLTDFMAQAHEKRLKAMDAVKAEVQRSFEEQIAELQSKLAESSAGASSSSPSVFTRVAEPALVGTAAGKELSSASVASTPSSIHPAYAARLIRPGWDARWGAEEVERASAVGVSTAIMTVQDVNSVESVPAGVTTASGSVHPAYGARFQRPGWEARWGPEEVARTQAATKEDTHTVGGGDVHPAYAARSRRPGWEARWGAEEPDRMAAAMSSVAIAAEPEAQTSTGSAFPVDVHPAYAARLQRLGWEARWGSEEKDRVAGALAGAVAVEGAAAGFATAGGLDTKEEGTSADGDFAVAAIPTEEPAEGDSLPNDVAELKEMVASFRQSFADYMLRSQQASNDLRAAKIKVDLEMSRVNTELATEQELRASLQKSFLDYMSRSGNAQANEKRWITHLESEIARLAGEAEEIRRFTEGYMVKASSEKQKAVEAAIASERAEASARIEALQEEAKRLQAST